MKIGIIALLRQKLKVTYFTNKEIWNWCFHDYVDPHGGYTSDLLTIDLQPYQPRKAKKDPKISDVVREARRVANKDTTVIVQGKWELDVNFNDYLFLVKPPAYSLLITDLGAILTASDYRSKIFVKGIFVEKRGNKNPPVLAYGVDFNKVALDRDRRSLMTGSQIALTLPEMWDSLILKDQGLSAAELYLKLLLEPENFLETVKARECISRGAAEKLFEKLKSMFSQDTFFYNAEDPNMAEVLPLNEDVD
jgi:hypothetical protein